MGGWVARQNGNNAKLSPKLKLKLKLKLCCAELGKKLILLFVHKKDFSGCMLRTELFSPNVNLFRN